MAGGWKQELNALNAKDRDGDGFAALGIDKIACANPPTTTGHHYSVVL